jgi:hypothetical protein
MPAVLSNTTHHPVSLPCLLPTMPSEAQVVQLKQFELQVYVRYTVAGVVCKLFVHLR